jgi:hypothetical protein
MHEHVGHEGGDRGKIAAGKLLRRTAIARRDEGKREQELQALLARQQDLEELHPDHQPCQQEHHPRDIEHRFGGAHRRNLHRSPCWMWVVEVAAEDRPLSRRATLTATPASARAFRTIRIGFVTSALGRC